MDHNQRKFNWLLRKTLQRHRVHEEQLSRLSQLLSCCHFPTSDFAPRFKQSEDYFCEFKGCVLVITVYVELQPQIHHIAMVNKVRHQDVLVVL